MRNSRRRTLPGFSALITGRKRFQPSGRAGLGAFVTECERIKINPIVNWPVEHIAAYIAEHDLPVHPLVARG